MDKFTKQSAETLDYDIEVGEWLPADDFVLTATSTVTPVGLTLVSTTPIEAGRVIKVWLAGGTNGVKYKVEVTMTTDDGRVKEKEFQVVIKDV